MKLFAPKARERTDSLVDPSSPLSETSPRSFCGQPDVAHPAELRVQGFNRIMWTGVVLACLCLTVGSSNAAHSAEDTRDTLSDYRKAAEGRTRNPNHKASPDDIGPDYREAGNKPRQFDVGVALYDANDFAGAYAVWLPLAKKDDLAAQRNVAHLLRHGKGIPQDLPRALFFYERASDGGLVPAAVNAGVMHLRGEGTRADPEAALPYLAIGVNSKHPVALYEVSLMLAQGLGVTKNPGKARAYLELSARSGYAPALQKLNELKASELISKNAKTSELHSKSANTLRLAPAEEVFRAKAQHTATVHPTKPRKSISLPTPASSAMSTPKVPPIPREPAEKPALREELTSGIQLVTPNQGRQFVQGSHLYKAGRYREAAHIWQQLADEGVVEAQFRLGELYFQGQGLPKDANQAVQWLTRAADQGHRGASGLLTRASARAQ